MNAETPVELVSLEAKDALAIFTTDDPETALAPTLAKVRAFIDGWQRPDVTTDAGRKEIASMAYKVTRSKGVLEKIGKELAAEAKKVPGKIDATRRHVERVLDGWRDEVRAPLDAWETAEEERKAKHQAVLVRLGSFAGWGPTCSAEIIRNAIAEVEAVSPAEHDEFAGEIEVSRDWALTQLKTLLAAREKADADAAELEALRTEKAEREAKEAEEKRKRDEEAAKERRDQELKEAAEKAATAAAAKAKADLEAKQKAEEEAERKRAANKAHQKRINNEIVADLQIAALNISEDAAKALVTLILRGQIRHLTINY